MLLKRHILRSLDSSNPGRLSEETELGFSWGEETVFICKNQPKPTVCFVKIVPEINLAVCRDFFACDKINLHACVTLILPNNAP